MAISSPRPLPQWAVLTCGHCFCNECIAIIVEQYSVGSRRRAIKCAICRQTTSHTEISYVFTAQSSSQDQEIPVKVNHILEIDCNRARVGAFLTASFFLPVDLREAIPPKWRQ